MSQHDFDIANQTASNTRVDINNALKALGSLSSGTSQPSTTYANMLWYNTGDNWLYMRNEADSAWLRFAYMDQTNGLHILDDTEVVNTAGTKVGQLGDQATSTWQAGTGTTQSLVSPANVKSAVLALAPPSPTTTTSGNAPYFSARAFVYIENGGNAAGTYSGQNISSVVRNGTGNYTVNFTTAMPNANYAISTGPNSQGSLNSSYGMAVGITAKTAGSFRVTTRRVTNHDIFECYQLSFVVFA